jgi:hypothetical protein
MELQTGSTVLVNALIAIGLTLLLSPLSFGLLTTVAGLVLLLVLLAYEGNRQRSVFQSVAFAAVCALAFTLVAAIVLQRFSDRATLQIWLGLIWACTTVLGTVIDRSRTSAPAASPSSAEHVSPRTSTTYGLGIGTSVPTPAFTESAPAALPQEGAPEAIPDAVRETPVSQSIPEQASAQPAPAPAQGYKPEETMIYVDVIGQGISFMRSVRAEHVARDIYRIVDSMPPDETWRYQPGQTVRCKKRKLSSGKAMVAFEEIVLQRVG